MTKPVKDVSRDEVEGVLLSLKMCLTFPAGIVEAEGGPEKRRALYDAVLVAIDHYQTRNELEAYRIRFRASAERS